MSCGKKCSWWLSNSRGTGSATVAFHRMGGPTERLIIKLERLTGTNPFTNFPVRTAADDEDFVNKHGNENCPKENTCVRIVVDASLSNSQIDFKRSTPPDDWLAMPGTITIIHNTENLFAVWGAGVDGRPIKDRDSARYTIFAREI